MKSRYTRFENEHGKIADIAFHVQDLESGNPLIVIEFNARIWRLTPLEAEHFMSFMAGALRDIAEAKP